MMQINNNKNGKTNVFNQLEYVLEKNYYSTMHLRS